ANSMGTAVGSGVIRLRPAIVQICVFGLLGAMLQGRHVVETVGTAIVPLHALSGQDAMLVALLAALSACVWVALATWLKMPISTSHSIVGGVAGAGLAVGAPVAWSKLGDIFLCWIFTPLGAAILGYAFYRGLRRLFSVVPPRIGDPLVRALIVVSGWYVAFSWGANDVANAVGVVSGANIMTLNESIALGGLAIVLGILTLGYRVIETIGKSITNLLPLMAFAAQLASAVNVHVYTLAGIPVSTSHSIVGAIFGVGLVRGIRLVNLATLKEIVICWIATPFVSGLVGYAGMRAIMFLMP
ncbi:MAG: inorganic phosphate transporter, partial [Lentisphaerae bacterium]|nr:inorganic phosphate transporter [Lentisphaerota bacterium]